MLGAFRGIGLTISTPRFWHAIVIFLLRYFTRKSFFLVIYIKRKIDPSILSDFYFDIEKRIYFIQRLIQRTVLSPPPLMKGLCCNGWQRVRSTRSTGVI
ncbi:hypothetical protein HanPSC8_Chr04g0164951 [Helianthus annuus]|nr:hypothetical protein HanPSC8_Chr04g0164951 [Helianthus annuus]